MNCLKKRRQQTQKPDFKAELTYPEAIVIPEKPSMKTRGKYRLGGPEGAVVHHTAGHQDAKGSSSVQFAINQGHCYFVITQDGSVYQQFSLDRYGSHAGKSIDPKTGESSVSRFLVGIEICAAGTLETRGDGHYTWFNKRVTNVREIKKNTDNQQAGKYQKFTDYQERALIDLLLWLDQNFPDFDLERVWGHDEVAGPKGLGYWRKNDPGGSLSMTMSEFRHKLKELKRIRANNPGSKIY